MFDHGHDLSPIAENNRRPAVTGQAALQDPFGYTRATTPEAFLSAALAELRSGSLSYRLTHLDPDSSGCLPVRAVVENRFVWSGAAPGSSNLPFRFRAIALEAMKRTNITGEAHLLLITEILRYPYGSGIYQCMRTAPLKMLPVVMRADESFETRGRLALNGQAIQIIESFGGRVDADQVFLAASSPLTIETKSFITYTTDPGSALVAALDPHRNPAAASAPALRALIDPASSIPASWPKIDAPEHLDADQTEALQLVLQGFNLRVFGPPGCGKSELISQIVGVARQARKSVLIASSVQSALDVIARRLNRAKIPITEGIVIADPDTILSRVPSAPLFDIALIDEATRMSVAESGLFITRAAQIVVCGDDMQMRPKHSRPDIYTFTGLRGFKTVPLRHHYRSKDDKLLFFSNATSYHMELITAPAPHIGCRTGVDLIQIGNATSQVSPNGRINEAEANVVAQTLVDRIQAFPAQSVGVIAMTKGQAILIDKKIKAYLQERGRDTKCLTPVPDEPFFSRTPDEAQGEERDYVIVSMVFAPHHGSLDGQLGVFEHDRPLNRINVSLSRARERCEVVVSYRPGDVLAQNSKSAGSAICLALHDILSTLIRSSDDVAATAFAKKLCQHIRAQGDALVNFGLFHGWRAPHADRYAVGIVHRSPAKSPEFWDSMIKHLIAIGWNIVSHEHSVSEADSRALRAELARLASNTHRL